MKNKAKIFIKNELKKRKITSKILSDKMKKKGYEYTDNTIRSKISRGTYSFSFLLEVCDSLDIDVFCLDKE